jgi:hypothetical protein
MITPLFPAAIMSCAAAFDVTAKSVPRHNDVCTADFVAGGDVASLVMRLCHRASMGISMSINKPATRAGVSVCCVCSRSCTPDPARITYKVMTDQINATNRAEGTSKIVVTKKTPVCRQTRSHLPTSNITSAKGLAYSRFPIEREPGSRKRKPASAGGGGLQSWRVVCGRGPRDPPAKRSRPDPESPPRERPATVSDRPRGSDRGRSLAMMLVSAIGNADCPSPPPAAVG